MLLAHLLPFLDAEIDRLQKARDLLAYTPSTVIAEMTETPNISAAEASAAGSEAASAAPALEAFESSQTAPRVVVLRARGLSRGWRQTRRRPAGAADTALRSAVPAGPVAVSAEEVRRGQAAKPALRSKQSDDQPTAFAWQSLAPDTRDVSALLRKLMDLGKQDERAQNVVAPV